MHGRRGASASGNRVETDHVTAKIKRLQGASHLVQGGSYLVPGRSYIETCCLKCVIGAGQRHVLRSRTYHICQLGNALCQVQAALDIRLPECSSMSQPKVAHRYRYDPLNRLIETAGIQRFYNTTRMATEIQGAVQHSVFQSGDVLLAQTRREGAQMDCTLLATDFQRSVLHGVSPDKVEPIAYNVYGHRPAHNGLLSVLGFNGERPDPVTGHYLLGNGYRAFNPVLMRFNSPDSWSPFGEGGINCYAYCGGDPCNAIDPSGHVFAWLRNKINSTFMREMIAVGDEAPVKLLDVSEGRVVYQNIKKLHSGVYVADEVYKVGGVEKKRLVINVHGMPDGSPGIAGFKGVGNRALSNDEMFALLEKKGVNVADYSDVHMMSCYSAAKGARSFSAELSYHYGIPVKAYDGKVTGGFTPADIWKRETKLLTWLQRGVAEVRQSDFSRTLEVVKHGRNYKPVVFVNGVRT